MREALVRSYRQAVQQQVRPLNARRRRDQHDRADRRRGRAPVEGRTLAEAGLPQGVRVLTMEHLGRLSAPAGDTVHCAFPGGPA